MEKTAARSSMVTRVDALVAAGAPLTAACIAAGVARTTYLRWSGRFSAGGLDALVDLPRSGRPGYAFSEPALDAVARAYLASNWRRNLGSLTAAARFVARDPASCLVPAERDAILLRSSKFALPAGLRRGVAERVGTLVAARHRDPAAGCDDGIYLPGSLRMSSDGSRRLLPGERQVWDDASVNVGVVVPWARGGDKCSDRYGVRVARFQLLACLDCSTDQCVGYSYVMRANDAYSNFDARSALRSVWSLSGYVPAETVLEGGVWQSRPMLDLLAAAGTSLVSAKGRPNQKLVEGWFSRLWTILPMCLPDGQVGRYRGEMAKETAAWIACREGRRDPRGLFPDVAEFLAALDRAIAHLNAEIIESRTYGNWVPAESYGRQAAKGHAVPAGLRRFALPVSAVRLLRRQMVSVAAESPLGFTHSYAFAFPDAWRFEGAQVAVRFDPAKIREGALVELAAPFHGFPAGTVVDESAPCVSPAPLVEKAAAGWAAMWLDPRKVELSVKRSSRALVGAQSAAFDSRGVRAVEKLHEGIRAAAVRVSDHSLPEPTPVPEPDWTAIDRRAGIVGA